eukprot:TRINITY_DN8052_c0_g1_i1.p1 TRINITY_DN8052_c0_g1~~TRINITY_DN8052_c0_g1_i1.p1  ORF type:complete len:628 (+),score=150.93 TRINITY_DN8052_c0_g1_i1:1338-3221(+)
MLAMITPSSDSYLETLSTLKFANRAKRVQNIVYVNVDIDEKALLRKYEMELKRLRQEIAEKDRLVVDKRRLLELENQKRRAEQDKIVVLKQLEARSSEIMREKQEKRLLEEQIEELQGQLLSGGGHVIHGHETLREEHDRIKQTYLEKLNELERERQSIEEDKAQVDRYRVLLLKQREVIYTLTERLNERNESILALQEEFDTQDRKLRQLEDEVDQKTATIIHLQRMQAEEHTHEQDSSSPRDEQAQVNRRGDAKSKLMIEENDHFENDDHARNHKVYKDAALSSLSSLQDALRKLRADNKQLVEECEHYKSVAQSAGHLTDVLDELRKEVDECRIKSGTDRINHSEQIMKRINIEVSRLEAGHKSKSQPKLESSSRNTYYDDPSSRIRSLEAKVETFRNDYQEMQQLLDARNSEIESLRKEHSSVVKQLRELSSKDHVQIIQDYERRMEALVVERRADEEAWRNERQKHIREIILMKQQYAASLRERQISIDLIENHVKPLVRNLTNLHPDETLARQLTSTIQRVQDSLRLSPSSGQGSENPNTFGASGDAKERTAQTPLRSESPVDQRMLRSSLEGSVVRNVEALQKVAVGLDRRSSGSTKILQELRALQTLLDHRKGSNEAVE